MKFPRLLTGLFIGLQILLWLSACTPSVVKQDTRSKLDWAQQQLALNAIQQWKINGRIAVQTKDDGGQADFVWQLENLSNYEIRLQAPLGAGTTWINSGPQGASIKNSSGDSLYDTDVDALILRMNGWRLPVSGLRYWVRGLPSPVSDYKVTEWNDNGLPAVVIQDGWRIEFRKHQQVSGQFLPRKLFINRVNMEEEVDVRLIIRQWVIDNV